MAPKLDPMIGRYLRLDIEGLSVCTPPAPTDGNTGT